MIKIKSKDLELETSKNLSLALEIESDCIFIAATFDSNFNESCEYFYEYDSDKGLTLAIGRIRLENYITIQPKL